MFALPDKRRMTAEEYLAFERVSETKHEFFNGDIVDFSGVNINHAQLVQNISSLLFQSRST